VFYAVLSSISHTILNINIIANVFFFFRLCPQLATLNAVIDVAVNQTHCKMNDPARFSASPCGLPSQHTTLTAYNAVIHLSADYFLLSMIHYSKPGYWYISEYQMSFNRKR